MVMGAELDAVGNGQTAYNFPYGSPRRERCI